MTITSFQPNELAIDTIQGPAEVKVIKPDPRDYRRWIVERENGFRYSASHFDLIKQG